MAWKLAGGGDREGAAQNTYVPSKLSNVTTLIFFEPTATERHLHSISTSPHLYSSGATWGSYYWALDHRRAALSFDSRIGGKVPPSADGSGATYIVRYGTIIGCRAH